MGERNYITDPSDKAIDITPSDGDDISVSNGGNSFTVRAISWSFASSIAVEWADGTTGNLNSLIGSPGVQHPISGLVKILDTGTTASDLQVWS